jgi:murein DD-endopeptidase MepM/ murein hydrolase activator NlpD
MDSIITSQTVARRRRPYSSSAPKNTGRVSFFEGFAASAGPSFLKKGHGGGSGSQIKPRAKKKGAARPATRTSAFAKTLPRSGGPSPAARLGGLLREGLRALKKAGEAAAWGRSAKRGPAIAKGPAEPRAAGRGSFFAGASLLRLPPPLPIAETAPLSSRKKTQRTGGSTQAFLSSLQRRGLALGGLALLLGLFALGFLLLRPSPFPLPKGELLPAYVGKDDQAADLLLGFLSPELLADGEGPDLAQLPLPKALEISSYTVKPGDSIGSIAKRFGRSVDSLVSLNGIRDVRGLRAGTELRVPNMDGLVHVVARGESLSKLASVYKVETSLLADANDLGSASLRPGQSLFIPGARLPEASLRAIYGVNVAWPARGPISSWFGVRSDPFTGVRRFHTGIDIVVNLGTPVRAAMDGRVMDLGYNANYGNYIILGHVDGLQTLYGHLSGFAVTEGQKVKQGSVIGASGNTGYSTGPHLHFGVYRRGAATNPLKLLK